ncbi:DUF1588 domain-containing protein [Tuwongella immobilis]|uniref:Haem-binding domain-containing protein n=1 Tax=Tuwongella immobilis TaxID=692036 RepID=A0A6C2YV98_9BACT|nr:DUF1588 domain-containing protein [Tuwongella immobilis]VIP05297.1 signal peptide protein : Uncharacterized protein OS=Pirellula staleyi (strain ATCC 27377 / DSM 6068 / ICPB 4128) GN=Psta_3062 PE=4 SV=1: PSD4: PSCyt3 [Tuwongella immobilis]VTS07950.1 signal peptide protein : Uncharacterized protein OS=Pirellula staleyi (strain ATCC 27377 / DSM 6068 / ICPB 4128) GN=Psta_3062 PE=4 SV=1: PSD4: PSCyt3 [Tuwongella immobilis]
MHLPSQKSRHRLGWWMGPGLLLLALGTGRLDAADPAPFQVPADVLAVLDAHCVDCHGEGGKGHVDVTHLHQLDRNERLETLNKIQDQLFYKMMPPPTVESPNANELRTLATWVRGELRANQASKLDERLPLPAAGNYIDHAALFDGRNTEKPFTPSRRWLVSPQIFRERVLDSLGLDGPARQQQLYGITNPFTLPERSGIRDYDLTTLDGTHFITMKTNAAWLADKIIGSLRIKRGESKEAVFPNPKDRWVPPTTSGKSKQPLMAEFEAILAKSGTPTDAEMVAAIQLQFGRVLARPATDAELHRYRQLMRAAIELGGNIEGLRKMLEAVWLESEFVYRLEWGAGEPDSFGRKVLSPREASYAIALALGDRGPDATLTKAAQEGRLLNKADYEREVKRLLADPTSFRGPVDPFLAREHREFYVSTPHPKIVRFFREFFGYPMALRVFKDIERSDGLYRVPDRGTGGTPGFLIVEADRVVARAVEQDRRVFETLLTTDEYFVYHNVENAQGAKLIDGWRTVYETLKNTNWRTNPDQVAKDHAELLKQYTPITGPSKKGRGVHDTDLKRLMTLFEDTFGRGGRPFTTLPWAHGNRMWHSPFYNLPRTPTEARYGKDPVFDYEPVQPFSIPNRKGILTHPAWLIAHSQNSATDPVRRGRWIREKLLAGVVPEVPITVDAQIPEHPEKTLRERLDLVTNKQGCIKCHQHMNPLGLAFEMYDDFGRFRKAESLEYPQNLVSQSKGPNESNVYKTKPVNTTGRLDGTGDAALDGEVRDALDLIDRLAKSERVRQSMIRHAFRFYLGRNEMLSDSQTLIDADRAYVTSGGSFKAVIVSLLTSDSFRYRK